MLVEHGLLVQGSHVLAASLLPRDVTCHAVMCCDTLSAANIPSNHHRPSCRVCLSAMCALCVCVCRCGTSVRLQMLVTQREVQASGRCWSRLQR